jgi:hypothetical protein
MTIKESLKDFETLYEDCSGNAEYINENKQIHSFIILLQDKLTSLELIIEKSISESVRLMFKYVYIYIYIHICLYIYIYIYI